MVRWTNIYDPTKLVFFGDIIGGPVKSAFGPVILDVDLRRLRQDHRSGFFTHTKYWALKRDKTHIEALRAAANLVDSADADPNSPNR